MTDLRKGQENEQRMASWLSDHGFEDIKFCEWKGYDIMATIGGKVRTFEVKTDFAETGNIAIEFMCLRRKETSGIMASSSDYWVQFDGYGSGMMWRTEDLREYIRNARPPMVYGGDNRDALMFLIRRDDLPPHKPIEFETGNGYF